MVTLAKNVISPGHATSQEAEAAIDQYDCVKIGTGDGLVIKTAAANDPGIGFVHTDKATAAGQGITVYHTGVVWARAAGSITAGVDLEATVDGEVTEETPAAGVTQFIVGRALAASAGANELIPVLITIYKYNDETP